MSATFDLREVMEGTVWAEDRTMREATREDLEIVGGAILSLLDVADETPIEPGTIVRVVRNEGAADWYFHGIPLGSLAEVVKPDDTGDGLLVNAVVTVPDTAWDGEVGTVQRHTVRRSHVEVVR